MSKQNKVNPGQYHVAGRLTPDELARERVKQRNVASGGNDPASDAASGTGPAAPDRPATPSKQKTPAGPGGQTTATARARAAGRSRK